MYEPQINSIYKWSGDVFALDRIVTAAAIVSMYTTDISRTGRHPLGWHYSDKSHH